MNEDEVNKLIEKKVNKLLISAAAGFIIALFIAAAFIAMGHM